MKTIILLILIAVSFVIWWNFGCATVTPETLKLDPYGFWYGLLHGTFVIYDLIAMFFGNGTTVVFHPNNNGAWYSFGFLLGCGGISVSLTGN